jgi:hypothetical protein
MDKAIFLAVILALAILILGVILLALRLKTGRSVRTRMAERPQLFVYSYRTVLVILVALFVIFVGINNQCISALVVFGFDNPGAQGIDSAA